MTDTPDVLVIGGGFYGMYLAEHLARRGSRALLCEREPDLMRRASYANQARVHNGYHYPRSVLTALRSRVNFPRFVDEFGPAIDSSFEKVYAVARVGSKVSAAQFRRFLERIGAPIKPAGPAVKKLFHPELIEEVFTVREFAFNSTVLKAMMRARAERAGVELRCGATVGNVRAGDGGTVAADVTAGGATRTVVAREAFCCAYAQANAPLGGAERVPLKHELAEMALVAVPEPLRGLGVTVMDGAFFSCMPFPARGLHTLSHVRYTPHAHWYDRPGGPYRPAYEVFAAAEKRTAFPHMVRDAARFLPLLRGCEYVDSLWEVKTVLPRSETDDSRPILFRPDHGVRNYHLVLGGKVDNVYDVADVIDRRRATVRAATVRDRAA